MSAISRTANKVFSRVAVKRPARKLSLGELATRLEEAGKDLEFRYGAALDNPANREKLRHVVGMERWGQRRLEVLLGKELLHAFLDGAFQRLLLERRAVHLAHEVRGDLAGTEAGHADARRYGLQLLIDAGVDILGRNGDLEGAAEALVQRLDSLHL